MIEVRPLRGEDEDAYRAFITGRADALLYHSLPYRDVLLEQLGCRAEYLLAFADGELRGALPAMWHQGVLNSLPFYGSHGAVLADDDHAAAALLAAWDERATDPSTAAATLVANPFARPYAEPRHDFEDERLNQAAPLGGVTSEAELLARAEPSAARNLRRARRSGISVQREAEALGALAALHAENMARIGGRAKDPRVFDAFARHFQPGADYDVYTARRDGELAAALLVFWVGAAAEYFTPVVAHAHRPGQPLAAVLTQAMLDAAARGLAWFNLGGTWLTQDGVRRFKRKWGARTVRYRYYTKVNDRALLDATPGELRERFGEFYVLPYALPAGATR